MPVWFVSAENGGDDQMLREHMQKANTHYNERSTGKGKAHPDGHRKTTLAGALLVAVGEANLMGAGPEAVLMMQKYDQMTRITGGRRTLAEQQAALKLLPGFLDTPEKLESAITICDWRETKKADKFILKIAIAPAHPLHELMDVIHTTLMILSTSRKDGTPPREPLVRQI